MGVSGADEKIVAIHIKSRSVRERLFGLLPVQGVAIRSVPRDCGGKSDEHAGDDIDRVVHADIHARDRDDRSYDPQAETESLIPIHTDRGKRRCQERVIGREAVVSRMGDERSEMPDHERARIEIDVPGNESEYISEQRRRNRKEHHMLLFLPRLHKEISAEYQHRKNDEIFCCEDEEGGHAEFRIRVESRKRYFMPSFRRDCRVKVVATLLWPPAQRC